MHARRLIVLLCAAAACLGVVFATLANYPSDESTDEPLDGVIGNFTLGDDLGAERSLSDWSDKRLVVVVFLGTECPLAKLYGPRLQEMADRYADQSVQFVGINSNRQDTLAEITHYARVHHIDFPILKDPGNQIADRFGAERTPEAFVLDQQREVRYSGRIDDQFGVGYSRAKPTEHDLTTAIDQLLAGRPVALPATTAVGCIIGRVEREEPQGDITYNKHIAHVLNEHCVRCHRAGQIAPFELTSYDEAVGWAETLAEVIRDQRMPPWHANPEHGHFSNDARMPAADKELLYQWVHGGMPEGDPADLPPLPEFAEGWRIEQPDMVFRMPEAFDVPSRGVVEYQHFHFPERTTEDLWVRAAEVRPGNRSVVHHLILFFIPPDQEQHRGEDALLNAVGTFAPGMPPFELPEGCALRIPAGSRFVIQAHYTPNGSEQTDQSEVGLVLADPTDVKHRVMVGMSLNHDFHIPPGDPNYPVTAEYRMNRDMLLYALTPHMHFRGKSFRYTARYTDGSEEILLDVPRYDFNWQNSYILAEPELLPEGTVIDLLAHFDNSAANLANPDPEAVVSWGEQTWEEMMIGSLVMWTANQDLTLGPPRVEMIDSLAGERRVHFRYQPTEPATTVYLAGSFNDWQATTRAMDGPDADGFFTATLNLAPGGYEYKFVVDGTQWKQDPGNPDQNGFYHNSVIDVQ